MSLRKFVTQVAECDKCSNSHDTDEDEFFAAKAELKRSGWAVRKDRMGNWIDICPVCLEDEHDVDDIRSQVVRED